MMKKKIQTAKQKAYAQQQEREGRKVVNWIFAILIILGLVYLFFAIQ